MTFVKRHDVCGAITYLLCKQLKLFVFPFNWLLFWGETGKSGDNYTNFCDYTGAISEKQEFFTPRQKIRLKMTTFTGKPGTFVFIARSFLYFGQKNFQQDKE